LRVGGRTRSADCRSKCLSGNFITWKKQKMNAKQLRLDYAAALVSLQRELRRLESLACKAAVGRVPADLMAVQSALQTIREDVSAIEAWTVEALPEVPVAAARGEFDWIHPPGMRH
jgi:hypothetical protein